MTNAQGIAAEDTLSEIEELRRQTVFQVQLTIDASGGAAKDAALSFLDNVVPQAINNLRGRLAFVATLQQTWSSWVDSAADLRQQIVSTLNDIDSWSLQSVVRDAGSQTVSDVGQKAKEVADAASGAGVKLLIGLGLVFAIIVAWEVR